MSKCCTFRQKKILVCVNIPGNKTDSDSDQGPDNDLFNPSQNREKTDAGDSACCVLTLLAGGKKGNGILPAPFKAHT